MGHYSYKHLNEQILIAAKEAFPTNMMFTPKQPGNAWWNEGCAQASAEKRREALRTYKMMVLCLIISCSVR